MTRVTDACDTTVLFMRIFHFWRAFAFTHRNSCKISLFDMSRR
jgi:hypothetical protein